HLLPRRPLVDVVLLPAVGALDRGGHRDSPAALSEFTRNDGKRPPSAVVYRPVSFRAAVQTASVADRSTGRVVVSCRYRRGRPGASSSKRPKDTRCRPIVLYF